MSKERYVSRGGAKLASVADKFGLDFKDKTVLDVGASTGGFTDYALQNGAQKVIAVDEGTAQMHPSLRADPRVELHERTDIRNFILQTPPNIVLVDVSFVSLREVLPHMAGLSGKDTQIVALVKPQFEVYAERGRGTGKDDLHEGIVKNERIRRQILRDFEFWSKKLLVIKDKADSSIAGAHGNRERFYLLKRL